MEMIPVGNSFLKSIRQISFLGVINQKTPTTILLTPNLEFHSFGFFARDFFHDLDPIEAKRWLFFEKFKMHLHHIQVRINNERYYARKEKHQ
jgi:hypothetical protein